MQSNKPSHNPFKNQLAVCPFNSAHTFEKQKLVFHIQRCKDKQKRLPYLAKCKFNPMHYVQKDKIGLHEQYCADRKATEDMHKKIQLNYRTAQRSTDRAEQHGQPRRDRHARGRKRSSSSEKSRERRSRSRERKEEGQHKQKLQKIQDEKKRIHDEEDDDHTLSDCEECQNIIKRYKEQIRGNARITKLIQKYEHISGYQIL